MSASGISGNTFSQYGTQDVQSSSQQIREQLSKLSQDLLSGSSSAAQEDSATLQSLGPQTSAAPAAQNGTSVIQSFGQLAQDLQSGNLSGAQQVYGQIKQDIQTQTGQSTGQHHRHHGGGSDGGEFTQLFDQLGQALQSGSLSSAQQVFSQLQNVVEQHFGEGQGTQQTASQRTSSSSSAGISVTA
jgi:hypothetical protein